VAISVDGPEASRRLAERLRLGFPLLSDPEKRAIRAYGVEETKTIEGYPPGIARPAVFVIDRSGRVRFKHISRDYADRPWNSVVLANLKGL